MTENDWQKELPNEEGDWLWVSMWSCGCCVSKSGIAWIHQVDPEYEKEHPENGVTPIIYKGKNDKWLGISWENQEPYFENDDKTKPIVTAWTKVKLPPKEWSDWKND
ncbi:hypothetical protein C4577_06595 [Candidatus Parcubacteria bacterium]|nr:MAG: hypothetical protein C4577_06595 [Candidatus Parcubacteria bacterium]